MVGKKMRLGDQTRDVQNNHQINSTYDEAQIQCSIIQGSIKSSM